jgi:type I restriction enzyme S subunit
MNADLLVKHFQRISDAPGAIARLRQAVLDLAIEGRLLEPNSHPEPVFDTTMRSKVEQRKMGKTRNGQSLRPLARENAPFAVSSDWQWLRLVDIGLTQTGTTPPAGNADHYGDYVPFVKPGDLTENGIVYSSDGISETGVRYSRLIAKRSTLMVCIGSSIGKVAVTDRDICCNQQINAFTPYLGEGFELFASLAMRATYFQRLVRANAGMATLPIISKGKWETLPIPVPPVAEQHRIITKVAELMALCDRLEQARNERETRRDRLTAASLHHLNNAEAGEDLREHARFFINHLPKLTARPDQIARLRQTVLNLAIRGKLVRQDSDDEVASILLNRVHAARSRSLTTEQMKFETIGPSEIRFLLSSSWVWVRLGEICSKTGSGSTPRGGRAVYQPSGIPFLRSQNIHDGGLRLEDVAYISKETHARMGGTAVSSGDLLLNITGGSIGRCCAVPSANGDANISQHVAIIRPALNALTPYLHRLILSPYFQSFVNSEQTGAGRGGLPKNRMDRIPVALPPLAEQHRIVAKVDELIALCNRLEERLATTQSAKAGLLDATLYSALTSDTKATTPS